MLVGVFGFSPARKSLPLIQKSIRGTSASICITQGKFLLWLELKSVVKQWIDIAASVILYVIEQT